ncbi:unnamed protein product [Peniophora sp. CBMAI 1063]|nr:unnamed protein product [Peniophora sp. CBMAI 1063]
MYLSIRRATWPRSLSAGLWYERELVDTSTSGPSLAARQAARSPGVIIARLPLLNHSVPLLLSSQYRATSLGYWPGYATAGQPITIHVAPLPREARLHEQDVPRHAHAQRSSGVKRSLKGFDRRTPAESSLVCCPPQPRDIAIEVKEEADAKASIEGGEEEGEDCDTLSGRRRSSGCTTRTRPTFQSPVALSAPPSTTVIAPTAKAFRRCAPINEVTKAGVTPTNMDRMSIAEGFAPSRRNASAPDSQRPTSSSFCPAMALEVPYPIPQRPEPRIVVRALHLEVPHSTALPPRTPILMRTY